MKLIDEQLSFENKQQEEIKKYVLREMIAEDSDRVSGYRLVENAFH